MPLDSSIVLLYFNLHKLQSQSRRVLASNLFRCDARHRNMGRKHLKSYFENLNYQLPEISRDRWSLTGGNPTLFCDNNDT